MVIDFRKKDIEIMPLKINNQITVFWLLRKFLHIQTYHFDLTQNLNECEKKSEYTEKNLHLTPK